MIIILLVLSLGGKHFAEGVVDCSPYGNSVRSPAGNACFAHYDGYKSWNDAFADCQSKALLGFKGRLAFANDQATYDLLRDLSEEISWVGLKAVVSLHAINPMVTSQWAWHEGDVEVEPLTFTPSAGEGLVDPSATCIRYGQAGTYLDAGCDIKTKYYCEFIQHEEGSTDAKLTTTATTNKDPSCASLAPYSPIDCAAIKNNEPLAKDGVYTVKPFSDCSVLDTKPYNLFCCVEVYCDMTTTGGGWTVFQNRFDGSLDFYQGWELYVEGFGSPSGEHWLGLEYIRQITLAETTDLLVELGSHNQNCLLDAHYSGFSLNHHPITGRYYQLQIQDFTGGIAGDSLTYHSGVSFSTMDADHDNALGSCSQSYNGAWWYNSCHSSCLNGLYTSDTCGELGVHLMWASAKGFFYSFKTSSMKIRPANYVNTSSTNNWCTAVNISDRCTEDCKDWTAWSPWSQCSVTCGQGIETRNRTYGWEEYEDGSCETLMVRKCTTDCTTTSSSAPTHDPSCPSLAMYSPIDCAAIKNHEPLATDGVYTVKPFTDCTVLHTIPYNLSCCVEVYCDMTTTGGGWTVFQNRHNGSVDFYKFWTDYVEGFGSPNGEYWLGLEYIRQMTMSQATDLLVELGPHNQNCSLDAHYSGFFLNQNSSAAQYYQLQIQSFIGGLAGDSLTSHVGYNFSTRDADHDTDNSHCSQAYRGAWWYNSCHASNLNGLYINDSCGVYAIQPCWYSARGYFYSFKTTSMKIRPASFLNTTSVSNWCTTVDSSDRCPEDCTEVMPWSNWSSCLGDCGQQGNQTRNRTCRWYDGDLESQMELQNCTAECSTTSSSTTTMTTTTASPSTTSTKTTLTTTTTMTTTTTSPSMTSTTKTSTTTTTTTTMKTTTASPSMSSTTTTSTTTTMTTTTTASPSMSSTTKTSTTTMTTTTGSPSMSSTTTTSATATMTTTTASPSTSSTTKTSTTTTMTTTTASPSTSSTTTTSTTMTMSTTTASPSTSSTTTTSTTTTMTITTTSASMTSTTTTKKTTAVSTTIDPTCANISSYLPVDCAAIKTQEPAALDGVYIIKPLSDCNQLNMQLYNVHCCVEVYCDMTTTGGGWTVFQKRYNGAVDFYRSWTDYVEGFGSPNDEHWLGLEYIKQIANSETTDLLVELGQHNHSCLLDGLYSGFSLGAAGSAADYYQLNLNQFIEGMAGDSLMYHVGGGFSTWDADHDETAANCSQEHIGAWWYRRRTCYRSNLNGLYSYSLCGAYGRGINWFSAGGYFYSFRTTSMKIRPENYMSKNSVNNWCQTAVDISDPCSQGSPCPNSSWHYSPSGEKCYWIEPDKMNWTSAQSSCESYGGTLAILKNQVEMDFAISIIPSQFSSYPNLLECCWIGLRDMEQNGTFKWIDGTDLIFTMWIPNNPNRFGGEHCVHLITYSKFDGSSDYVCSKSVAPMCEWVLPKETTETSTAIPTTTSSNPVQQFCISINGTWYQPTGSCFKYYSSSHNYTTSWELCSTTAPSILGVRGRLAHLVSSDILPDPVGWVGLRQIEGDLSTDISAWRWIDDINTPVGCVEVSNSSFFQHAIEFHNQSGRCMGGTRKAKSCNMTRARICEFLPESQNTDPGQNEILNPHDVNKKETTTNLEQATTTSTATTTFFHSTTRLSERSSGTDVSQKATTSIVATTENTEMTTGDKITPTDKQMSSSTTTSTKSTESSAPSTAQSVTETEDTPSVTTVETTKPKPSTLQTSLASSKTTYGIFQTSTKAPTKSPAQSVTSKISTTSIVEIPATTTQTPVTSAMTSVVAAGILQTSSDKSSTGTTSTKPDTSPTMTTENSYTNLMETSTTARQAPMTWAFVSVITSEFFQTSSDKASTLTKKTSTAPPDTSTTITNENPYTTLMEIPATTGQSSVISATTSTAANKAPTDKITTASSQPDTSPTMTNENRYTTSSTTSLITPEFMQTSVRMSTDMDRASSIHSTIPTSSVLISSDTTVIPKSTSTTAYTISPTTILQSGSTETETETTTTSNSDKRTSMGRKLESWTSTKDPSSTTEYSTAGTHITTLKDSCLSNPCKNGNCTSMDGSYICICQTGFVGFNCESEVDECRSSPCLNGASCSNMINGYWCMCTHSYTGINCEDNINKCESMPCFNNGSCEDNVGTYHCTCLPGFNGTNCEHDVDECSLNKCQNNSTCKDGINSFTCECTPGFSGTLCNVNINECSSHPCQYSGTCEDEVNGYKCKCPKGYYGTNCELGHECNSQPCLNGATCKEEGNGYTCLCTKDYKGKNCNQKTACASSPCKHGTCIDMNERYRCNCMKGYTGMHCDISSVNFNINQCSSDPCMNGGTCHNYNYYYKCACAEGFTGTNCEIDDDECISQPCQNNGTCYNGIASYNCSCLDGYNGSNCEQEISECDSDPCLNDGKCIDFIGSYGCVCLEGFNGSHCEQEINECDSSPCMNNGRCVDQTGMYTCHCTRGYNGTNCEKDINECDSDPCLNNGRCIDEIGAYSCTCPYRFVGVNCEKEIKECQSNPCLNNGECTDGIGGYSCTCANGYNGTHCEQEIMECDSNPCQNNGRCTDHIGSYICACPRGYHGTHCEKEIKECLSNPCLNNGECTDGIGGYSCECVLGYNGTHCEQEIMECNSNPCQNNGRCTDHIGSYICTCPHGYSGTHCEKEIKECFSNPCLNNGECTDGIGGYICKCVLGYNGTHCEQEIMECESNPCQNKGKCTEGIGSYTCRCLHQYKGTNCEKEVKECFSSPCLNNGECSDGIGSYTCICPVGYSGIHCEEDVNECASNPCVEGKCEDLIGKYNCICPNGTVGEQCNEDFDECSSNPCGAHGTCHNLKNHYNCSCEQGFLGDMCEKEENKCDSNPCLNNGTCADMVGAYECACLSPYKGVVCQEDFDECTSNPCGSGTCVNLVGKYRCKCIMATGPRCETSIPKGTRLMKLGSKAQGNKWPFNPRDFPELDEESPFDDGEVTAAVLPNGTVVLVPLDPDQPEPQNLTILCKQEPNPDGSCHAKWFGRAGTCLVLQNMTSSDKTCFEGKAVEANDPVMKDPAVLLELSKSEPIDKPSVPLADIDPNDCWGPCSVSCGIGRRQNLKNKVQCSKLEDTQLCRDRECPINCEYVWNIWGECSAPCGSGIQWRTPLVKQKPRYGGTKCPDPQKQSCNTEECPTEATELTPSTSTTTTSTSTTTEPMSTTPVFPLSETEEVVVNVLQSLGCMFILGSLAFTLAVFLIMGDFSHERCLQMNMEIALLLGHILVLTMRHKTDWPIPCKLASIGMQFFFVASFAFMALEALQAYAMCTNVISSGGYFTSLESFIIGWGGSMIVTAVTATLKHDNYVSHWSCWTNLGNSVAMATLVPVGCLSAAAIVLAEASGMGTRQLLPGTNKDQRTAAIATANAILIILPISVAAWFCGLFAVYHPNLPMASLVTGLNISLGVSIFMLHSLGNPKVHAMLKKMFSKCCGN